MKFVTLALALLAVSGPLVAAHGGSHAEPVIDTHKSVNDTHKKTTKEVSTLLDAVASSSRHGLWAKLIQEADLVDEFNRLSNDTVTVFLPTNAAVRSAIAELRRNVPDVRTLTDAIDVLGPEEVLYIVLYNAATEAVTLKDIRKAGSRGLLVETLTGDGSHLELTYRGRTTSYKVRTPKGVGSTLHKWQHATVPDGPTLYSIDRVLRPLSLD